MNRFLAIYLSSLLLLACSNSTQEYLEEGSASEALEGTTDTPEMDGMILVHAGTATLGSNDSKYRTSERPAMKVILDYDFYLGKHEVTCGEYSEIATKMSLKDFGNCDGDSLPLADITYYDAALFANAKGKLENRDTAYTYSKAAFDSEGHCTYLESFAFHPEAKAYRLPTEAEWVLAASQGWNPESKSWNADNSGFRTHDVCSIGKDTLGFCDLAGNVKEWVNDWAGSFRNTSVTNYLGAPDGGDLGERVLKGGYFSDRASELNIVARGDEYTVEASSHADRIGFRFAFGAIPNPVWLDASGNVKGSIVTPLSNVATLKSYTGTYNMLLAFRNDVSGNLAYIDYGEGNLSVTEIDDTLEVYHPDISPDGKLVAFCTKPEGVSGKSSLYVRDLNAEGTNLKKLDVESAAIPRWRVLRNGDTVIVYVTDAGNNKDEATFKNSSTWQVKFAGGKFGTPEKLFDGAFHGGISEDNMLAVTGARLLRARIADSASTLTGKAANTIWYDTAQACNASLAQDGSKRTLFLDFGGKPGRTFAGENYATHERILIADSNGKLQQTIKAPAGFTFDHSEWASDGEISNIVATITNTDGAHTKIVLASPSDSSTIELAEGDELWHPCLWVERKAKGPAGSEDSSQTTETPEAGIDFELNPDSAGIYYTVGGSEDAEKFRYKMQLLWQYRDSATVVILGSSRTFHSVIPELIRKPHFALNMANDHNTLIGSFFLFKNYVLPHFSNLKCIVVEAGMDRLKYLDSFWDSEAWTYPGWVYDQSHDYWKDGIPQKMLKATEQSLGKSKTMKETILQTRGYKSQKKRGWGDSIPSVNGDSSWHVNDPTPFNENLELLKEIARLTADKGIRVIILEPPQSPSFRNTGAYGKNGILRSEAPALLESIQNISQDYPHVVFMDENKMGEHDYTDDMAYDRDHLGSLGAEKISRRLDSLIQTLDIDFSSKE